ncbi:uncharacterized protein M6B38_343820 [Iris pallida]|uniref:Uncharacterized protein n=1 Tax=Iris pallida TaxID=29817 RepID=A0AAX6GVD0_IRIPA|nr:uncharacterized protein M6B38_343820 [Iris pallida]
MLTGRSSAERRWARREVPGVRRSSRWGTALDVGLVDGTLGSASARLAWSRGACVGPGSRRSGSQAARDQARQVAAKTTEESAVDEASVAGSAARARALRSSPGGYRSEGGRGRPTECGGLGSGSGASVEVSGGCSVEEVRLRRRRQEAAKEWSGSCRLRARRGETGTVVGER